MTVSLTVVTDTDTLPVLIASYSALPKFSVGDLAGISFSSVQFRFASKNGFMKPESPLAAFRNLRIIAFDQVSCAGQQRRDCNHQSALSIEGVIWSAFGTCVDSELRGWI